VERYGRLRVEGGRLVGRDGEPVRLRGVSLAPSRLAGAFYSNDTVQWLVKDWKITLLRAAMSVEGSGYLANRDAERLKIRTVVRSAIAAGIYVLIAWHDREAERHLEEARGFFEDAARTYGNQPNVLFEPFSEPGLQAWSTAIRPYHEEVVAAIRRHSSNVAVLGTRRWSRALLEAAEDPVAEPNVAYALHFGASAPDQGLRGDVSAALKAGICVFASQWVASDGTSNASLGAVNTTRMRQWTDFLEENDISDAYWGISNNAHAHMVLQRGVRAASGWQVGDLKTSGAWVRASLRGEAAPPPPCGACSAEGANCKATGCCSTPGMTCFEKDEFFAGCMAACTPGVHEEDSVNFQTSWSCRALGGGCTAACAARGSSCKASGCCRDKSLTCFAKDEAYSGCRESCTPGLNPRDPVRYRTPWSCNASQPDRPEAAMVTSEM